MGGSTCRDGPTPVCLALLWSLTSAWPPAGSVCRTYGREDADGVGHELAVDARVAVQRSEAGVEQHVQVGRAVLWEGGRGGVTLRQ